MKPTHEILAELKALAEKATPGPWWPNGLGVQSSLVTVAEGLSVFTSYSTLGDKPVDEALANSEFISAARTALPRLVEALTVALKFVERIEGRGAGPMAHRLEAKAALEKIHSILNGEKANE